MQLDVQVGYAELVGYLLAMVRAIAWVFVCPPFGTRMVPTVVKVGFAGALSLAVGPRLAGDVPESTFALAGAAALNVVVGLALGFLGLMVFAAVQSAGSLIDVFGGFAIAQLYDPISGTQVSVFGRFYQLLAAVLLFTTGGHLLLIRGFMTSFDVVGSGAPSFDSIGDVMTGGMAMLLLAALEIAAPLLAALFLADVALGLLAKAAPEMNILLLGLPLKLFLTITLAAVALPLLPGAVSSLVAPVVEDGLRMLGG